MDSKDIKMLKDNIHCNYMLTDINDVNQYDVQFEIPDMVETETDEQESLIKTPDKNESGVLTFDEVKDIIVYYDFKDVNLKSRHLFSPNDYNFFNSEYRSKYMNALFGGEPGTHVDNNRSYSTKDSSSNKKNFASIIKFG